LFETVKVKKGLYSELTTRTQKKKNKEKEQNELLSVFIFSSKKKYLKTRQNVTQNFIFNLNCFHIIQGTMVTINMYKIFTIDEIKSFA
jgi:hypothetical protein